eukprot:IDg2308t1
MGARTTVDAHSELDGSIIPALRILLIWPRGNSCSFVPALYGFWQIWDTLSLSSIQCFVPFMRPRFLFHILECLGSIFQIRLFNSSSNSVSGMSSTNLEFLFSVKTAASCSILAGFASHLSFDDIFFVKSSTASTCVEENIVASLVWFVSIFSTIDKEISVSIVHIWWGSA